MSFNVRGLGHPIKRKRILTFLKKEKADVALLQETHLSSEEHKKLKRDWVGQVYFSSFASNKRGVATLIHKNLPFIFKEQFNDPEGRYVLIHGTLYGRELTLLNIYAPNADCPKFMIKMITLFSQYNTEFGTIAGDFNCCMESSLDKSSPFASNPNASKALKMASNDAGLVDVWREFNPLVKDYTFYSARHKTYSRLDFFLVPQGLLPSVNSCSIGSILISDHAPVYLRLLLHEQIHSTRYWKFNSSFLTNTEACNNIRQWLEQYRQENEASPVTPAVIWDAAKAVLRGQLISYASARKKKINKQTEQLKTELSCLEQLHKQSPTEANKKKLNTVRNSLNLLQIDHAKKLLFFTKQHYHEYGNKPSKLLAYQLKKEQAERTIKCIRNAAGQLKYDLQSIKSSFFDYYTKLYTSDNPSEVDIKLFLQQICLPSISEEEKELLDSPFTSKEVFQAILSLPTGKAPGLDGYPVEFYKAFWPQIEPLFMPMITDFVQNGTLPETLKIAAISLIHKKDKDASECSSFRPISLLPVDFKIISKLIARRLENLLPKLINPDQSGFVKTRNEFDNVRRLLNIIDHSALYKQPALIISLDAEKAFDRVEWPYLFSVLKKFNIGDRCLGWIKSMYSNPQAQICVNGTLSEKLGLHRGCRQGCPLSPFLFNLAIEPFAEAVRLSSKISGICIDKIENRISLYADDIILYLNNPENSVPAALDLINTFGRISGYKINLSKSNAFLMNMPISNKLKTISPFTWSQTGFKYLGVNVSPNLKDLFHINYPPLIKKIKEDLEHWNLLPISLLGRINVIKMNILPRINFLFQSLPCYLNKDFFKNVNKLISSFIWKNSTPRISFKTLTNTKEKGGLGLPDLQLYYWSAQIKGMIGWIQPSRTAHWTDIEEALCSPIPLTSLPFINNMGKLPPVTRTYVIHNILRAWQDAKRFCGFSAKISMLAPLSPNPDLPSSLGKSLFIKWKEHGICQFRDLFINDTLKSFIDLRQEFKIPRQDFYKYLQIRHLIISHEKRGQLSLKLSNIEEILVNSESLKGKISEIYSALLEYYNSSLGSLKNVWQRDLGYNFNDDQWEAICQNTFIPLSNNRIIEQNYKFIHRMYLTPLRLSKMYPNVSPRCHRCKTYLGSIMHVFWECKKLKFFWKAVQDFTAKALQVPLDNTPTLYLFGTELNKTLDPISIKRLGIISYLAKKCILLNWNQQKPPTFELFIKLLNETMPLEQYTYYLKNKGDAFQKIWMPLMILSMNTSDVCSQYV